MANLYFAKLKPEAKVPNKDDENAGYDLYACFKEDSITIEPGKIKLIPTGIATAFSSEFVFVLKERSSSGSKGLSVRAGIIDSGYRGEIFIALNNTINKPIIISKKDTSEELNPELSLIWPYKKAIAQGLLLPVPKTKVLELSLEQLQKISSKRGGGALGSTQK